MTMQRNVISSFINFDYNMFRYYIKMNEIVIIAFILWLFVVMNLLQTIDQTDSDGDRPSIIFKLNSFNILAENYDGDDDEIIKLFDHIQLKKYAIAKQLNIRTNRIDFLWEKLKYSYMQLFNYYPDNQILFIKYFDSQINSIIERKIQIFDQKVRLLTLSKRMQHHLYRLQNPTNCSQNIRKLVCYLDKQCGFGCQIHHLSYCFIVAYATHRTLLLYNDGNNWQYSINGWQSIFQPLSNTCRYNHLSKDELNMQTWDLIINNSKPIIYLPYIDHLQSKEHYLPQSLPSEYAQELIAIHDNPYAWFIGQFVYYLMKYSDNFNNKQNDIVANKDSIEPIVGIHIRRTDKIGTEANYHHIDEYMIWVENWFAIESIKIGKYLQRKVFVASDDVQTIIDITNKYKNYKVIANIDHAVNAQVNRRYSEQSLISVIDDVRRLSKCNYLVCTFSSQICRLAYELMQVEYGDDNAADRVHSIDDIYYFGGQQSAHKVNATKSYMPTNIDNNNEIELQIGDVIEVNAKNWNDQYFFGKNLRTNISGYFPADHVHNLWNIFEFSSKTKG